MVRVRRKELSEYILQKAPRKITLNIRMSESERQDLHYVAQMHGLSMSDVLRALIYRAADELARARLEKGKT